MKRKYFILIVLFFQTLYSFGQDSTMKYKNQIKFSPSSVINEFNCYEVGPELSYERMLSKYISTQISTTYFVDLFNTKPNGHTNLQGFKFMVEGKCFYYTHKVFRHYISVDITYENSKFNTIERFGSQTLLRDSAVYANSYLDSISVNRQGIGLNLKWGMQITVKRIVFEISAGIGAKYMKILHGNRINTSDKLGVIWHTSYYYDMTKQGEGIIENFPINIKIGYNF